MASSPHQKARMKAVCTTDCQHKGRYYAKGDRVEVREGEPLPAHFSWPGAPSFVSGGEPLPYMAGGKALVLGDAPSLLDDIKALRVGDECRTIGINAAPFRWQGRVDFWASLHGSLFGESRWLDLWMRCPWHGGTTPRIITGRRCHGLDSGYSLVHCDMPGGSAYLALKAAHEMGFKEIFVAGVDALSTGYAHFAQPLRHIAATIRRSGVTVRAASGALMEE